jgi:hypothetical protein
VNCPNAPYTFSHEHLRFLYRSSLQRGYRPLFFGEEVGNAGPYLLWRHDVDLDLEPVVPLARLEKEEGIRSTYFLMVRSWFYNVFSWQVADLVSQLIEVGHQVGLHCDLGVRRDRQLAIQEIEDRVARDWDILDRAFPGMISRVVSFHNPPTCVLRLGLNRFYSTYQAKFFGEVKYLSDSNRVWRDAPPEGWFDPAKNPRLCILLHPEIWAHPGSTMPEAMASFLAGRFERTREMLIHDDVHV